MPISEHRTDAKLTDLLVTLANGRRRVRSQSMTAVAPAMSDIALGLALARQPQMTSL
jgi:hypothetical protein